MKVAFFNWNNGLAIVMVILFTTPFLGVAKAECLDASQIAKKHEKEFLEAIHCSPDATGGVFVGMITNCQGEWIKGISGVSVQVDDLCYSVAVGKFKDRTGSHSSNVVCESDGVTLLAMDGVLVQLLNIGKAVAD